MENTTNMLLSTGSEMRKEYRLYNHTLPDLDNIRKIAFGYFATMVVCGTLGNGLVLLAFIAHRPLRAHSMNLLMVHTSTINLLASFFVNGFYVIAFLYDDYRPGMSAFAFLQTVNVISMYSLCSVGVNRWLLLTRPHTAFRMCCVRRSTLAKIMFGIMTGAVITTAPIWLLVTCPESHLTDQFLNGVYTILKNVAFGLTYLPMIVIPVTHALTLRAIGKSRRRIQSHSVWSSAADSKERVGYQHKGPFRVSGTNGLEVAELTTLKDVAPSSLGIASTSNSGGVLTNDQPSDSGAESAIVEGRKSRIRNKVSMRLRPMILARSIRPHFKRHLGVSEVRIVKMMVSMYIVLSVPMIMQMTTFADVSPTNVGRFRTVLYFYGYFMPVYPAAMPYIFLCSNKKFKSAASNILRRKTLNC